MKGDGYLVPSTPTPAPSSSSSDPHHHHHPSEAPSSSSAAAAPPIDTGEGADTRIWTETWKRVDRFLPGMRQEIFPDPSPRPQPPPPPLPSAEQQEEVGKTAAAAEGGK